MTNLYHQREALKARGMSLISTSALSDLNREYWGYTDRPNAMFDHTATITEVGPGNWIVSDFDIICKGAAA